MTRQAYDAEVYSGSGPENYEKYFVPTIGAPLAHDLIEVAALRPGERVLDVACGTGLMARLATERVGKDGVVAGLDVNPGMLSVARSVTPNGSSIDWYETSAEAMPLPDRAFDVVLCQMGLQFVPDKLRALREIRRILEPGGRFVTNLPGPTPAPFVDFGEALARHVDPGAEGFVNAVFSLHDERELRDLMTEAGFEDVRVAAATKSLQLPPPRDFMWQYIHSTPLVGLIANATDEQRSALEDDIAERWQRFVTDGAMRFEVRITTVTARAA